jgi:hypothetical protein
MFHLKLQIAAQKFNGNDFNKILICDVSRRYNIYSYAAD